MNLVRAGCESRTRRADEAEGAGQSVSRGGTALKTHWSVCQNAGHALSNGWDGRSRHQLGHYVELKLFLGLLWFGHAMYHRFSLMTSYLQLSSGLSRSI